MTAHVVRRPSVFIGSSSLERSLDIARIVQSSLQPFADAHLWLNPGIFPPGQTFIGALNHAVDTHDFGVFVFSADDTLIREDESRINAPRDNVIFEMGLFMGRLGPERTFFVYDEHRHPKILSDLQGVVGAFVREGSDLESSVPTACNEIIRCIRAKSPLHRSFTSLINHSLKAFGISHPVFQANLGARYSNWCEDAEGFGKGAFEIRIRTDYGPFLKDVYNAATTTIVSTSLPQYRDIWGKTLGKQLLRIQRDLKNKVSSTRIFVFDSREDLTPKDREIFAVHEQSGIEVLVFFDKETGDEFQFPATGPNDWTFIDDGLVIGVTEFGDKGATRATFYFGDENKATTYRQTAENLRGLSTPLKEL